MSTLVLDHGAESFKAREAIDALLRHWKLVLGIFLTLCFLGIGYALFAEPAYLGDVLIQIEEKKGSQLGGMQQIATALDVGQSPVAGEIEILRSREVVGQAIRELGLQITAVPSNRVPYFAAAFERKIGGRGIELAGAPASLQSLGWGGEDIRIDSFTIPDYVEPQKFILQVDPESKWTLKALSGGVIVSGMVGIPTSFQYRGAPSSITVSSILARPGTQFKVEKKSLVATYHDVLDAMRTVEATRQSSVLRVTYESRDPRQAVAIVNAIARAYLLQNVARRSEEAQKSLEFLEQQLPELKRDMEIAEQALNSYRLSRQSVDLDKESEALLNRAVELQKNKLETEMKQRELQERFQPNHPELRAVASELAAIQSEDDQLSGEIKRLPQTEQEFFRLERDVKVDTDLYVALLNNAQQLKVAKAGTIGNVHVIDFAVPAERPVSPQRVLIVLLTLFFSSVVSVASAFALESFKPTLRSGDEIEAQTGIPVYASVIDSTAQRELHGRGHVIDDSKRILTLSRPTDPAIESLRAMRTGLQFAMAGAENKNVMICGPTEGIGKTFISANLAAILAAAGNRILLIDADMRRPKIHYYFATQRVPGLSGVLAGTSRPADAICRNVIPNVDVIPAGVGPPNPGELLLRSALENMLSDMQSHYDYIIIDTPPILPVGDSLGIARLAAALFVVVRAEKNTLQQFNETRKRLTNAGATVKGIVFNGVPKRRLANYGYGYGYEYTADSKA